ncbi:MAG: hypothetical protein LR000_00070 [Candidatus Pacebacteria bacterium]|nr:hypothetical protein [Candidatus Paceibacterota bacterium]
MKNAKLKRKKGFNERKEIAKMFEKIYSERKSSYQARSFWCKRTGKVDSGTI